MILETKYGLGDVVYPVYSDTKRIRIPCTGCTTTGKISLDDGTEVCCPRCRGQGHKSEYGPIEYTVGRELRIGQVRARATEGKYQSGSDEPTYMCVESGIGSGAVHYERQLFPTREAAQAECDRLKAAGAQNK